MKEAGVKGSSFIGRLPLWATLIPLVLGVAFWGWMWRDYAARFQTDLEAVAVQAGAPVDAKISVGGFPYRLEARIPDVVATLDDAALKGRLVVKELTVNRVPWQADRQVLNLDRSVAEISVAPLAGASARVEANEAQASLHLDGERIGRLSMVWEAPKILTGLLPVPISAGHFEAHLREIPGDAKAANPQGAEATSLRAGEAASPPARAQLVLGGKDVRFGAGDALALALDSEITGAGPLRSFASWANGGAVEIRSAALTDATGEVARLTATLRPDGKGALQLVGQVETLCPASVRAVIAGTPQPDEKRARKPELIALSGTFPGGVIASAADPSKPPPSVRGQEPACPRLR